MKMIGKHDHCGDGHGPLAADVSECLAQAGDRSGVAKHRTTVGGDDGEKIGCAGNEGATVVHQGGCRITPLANPTYGASPGVPER